MMTDVNRSPIKPRKIQAHFVIPEDQWRLFQAILPNEGYSTASEFLRAKIRELIENNPKKRGNKFS